MENTITWLKQWAIDNDYICDSLKLLNRINMQKNREIKYK